MPYRAIALRAVAKIVVAVTKSDRVHVGDWLRRADERAVEIRKYLEIKE